MNNNYLRLVESAKYIKAQYNKVMLCNKKISGYEALSYYPQNSPRQAWVERRNEAINLAFEEIRKWNLFAGRELVVVPAGTRVWQENVDKEMAVICNFLIITQAILVKCYAA